MHGFSWLYNPAMLNWFKKGFVLSVLLCLGLFSSYQTAAQTGQSFSILSPGENSVVTAPINIGALLVPGDGELVRVILIDGQQNLLARQVLRVNAPAHTVVELVTELAFEIPGETTSAILTIVTQDQANRPIAIRSVPLTLKSSGEGRITSQFEMEPWLTLHHPTPGAVISQTPLYVAGSVKPINDRPVIFELINEHGNAIITRQLGVEQPGELIHFQIELPYSPTPTIGDMRLVIRQTSDYPGIIAILDSVPITIVP